MNPLIVAIHLQDDDVSCGLTCAQMVARFFAAPIHQQTEFISATPNLPDWNTSPDQLCDMLNQFRPAAVPPYVVFAELDPITAMDHAIAGVDNPSGVRCPVAAATFEGGHWEVVTGFTDSANPNPMVHARNPLPERTLLFPNTPPPPHADNDQCDVFNITQGSSTGGIPADEAVAWNRWIGHYFTPAAFDPPRFNGHHIVVAPGPAPKKKPPRPRPPHRRVRAVTGLPLLPLHLVTEFAVAGLMKTGLLERSGWRESVPAVPPGFVQPSLLVTPLEEDDPFVLVSLPTDKDRGTLVGVNATTGEFLFARLNPSRQLLDSLFAPQDELKKRFDDRGLYKTRVVWTPARESFFSPYFPFMEFAGADGQKFYVRLFDRERVYQFNRR
jgi:hypothetical protein